MPGLVISGFSKKRKKHSRRDENGCAGVSYFSFLEEKEKSTDGEIETVVLGLVISGFSKKKKKAQSQR
ncbi:MAG: hypothetical protein K2X01_10720 [Cyanobacteria bacterium]|nr:hypothetical protein [Cyanobacteriota bacterium]